jgi:hypothetical protein
MRRSIAELCVPDHQNDPEILRLWLSNKTREIFKSWIRPDNMVLVAVEGASIAAVGCVTDHAQLRFAGCALPGHQYRHAQRPRTPRQGTRQQTVQIEPVLGPPFASI